MSEFLYKFLISLSVGTLSRVYLMRVDYRQYPSYPRGIIMHLTFGIIAAALGSIALPALIAQDFTAVTFLTLAAEQFRSIRTMERENLSNIEEMEIIIRGKAYIEDIAKIFEARNYIVVLVSLTTSGLLYTLNSEYIAVTGGFIVLIILKRLMKGQQIWEIANVRTGKIWFDGAFLCVDDIVLINVGLKEKREKILKNGIAVILEPFNPDASITLSNLGQRQAIIHDVVAQMGIKKDVGEPDFTPIARQNTENGNMAIIFFPYFHDEEAILEAVRRSPVLESARRKPSQSRAGTKAEKRGG